MLLSSILRRRVGSSAQIQSSRVSVLQNVLRGTASARSPSNHLSCAARQRSLCTLSRSTNASASVATTAASLLHSSRTGITRISVEHAAVMRWNSSSFSSSSFARVCGASHSARFPAARRSSSRAFSTADTGASTTAVGTKRGRAGLTGVLGAAALLASLTGGMCYADSDNSSGGDKKMRNLFETVVYPFSYAYETLHSLVAGPETPLLPPPQPDVYGRPVRTVVVNLDKTLVYAEWSRQYGWVVRKRPFVDEFLLRLFKAGYEVILFCNDNQHDVEGRVDMLDANQVIKHRLYLDSTNFKKGKWVKDISRLQRDLKRVIVVDHDASNSVEPIENAISIPPFTDALDDRELLKVLAMLEGIQKYNVFDVREKVSMYNANDPLIFEKEERIAAESMQQLTGQDSRGSGKKGGGLLGVFKRS